MLLRKESSRGGVSSVKRTLSVVSVVPLAVALLLAMGGATTASAATAGATTATTTSSTSSTVKARAQQDYPDHFSCNYTYNSDESDNQYWCSYRYYYDYQWHQYHWWDLDYNPPNWSSSSSQDYPNYFSCNYRYNRNESDNQYWCSYRYYYDYQWHQYHWWDLDYNPPNWSSSSSQDYPNYFSCNYRYNRNESDNQYWCSYRYYYDYQWHQYH